jgi:hypothetical protein
MKQTIFRFGAMVLLGATCIGAQAQDNGNGNGYGLLKVLETDQLPAGAPGKLLDAQQASQVTRLAINIGQLAGLDLSGLPLASMADLMPLVVQSLTVKDDAGTVVVLDENGVQAARIQSGEIALGLDAGAAAVTNWTDVLRHVNWAAVTNLPPVGSEQLQAGSVRAEHLGFDPDAAAGEEGAVQYNAGGQLSGHPDHFIHAQSGRPAIRVQNDDLIRAYRTDDSTEPENLIFSLRREKGSADIVLLKNGQETVRISGEGNVVVTGDLQASRLTVSGEMSVSQWLVPEAGDLSMGPFVTQ